MGKFLPYTKAIVATAVAFSGAVATGYADGNMVPGEWWTAAAAGLVALSTVFGFPNKAKNDSNAMGAGVETVD